MPNITTISSFVDEPLKISTAVNESAGVDNNSGLDKVITETERRVLKKVFGDAQYVLIQAELGKRPFNYGSNVDADQAYIDLVNGAGSWQGLRPMLENAIFCEWLEVTEITQTAVGSGKGKTQGFTVADNSAKYVKRWNIFVDEYEDLLDYLSKSEVFEYEIQQDVSKFLRGENSGSYEYKNSIGI